MSALQKVETQNLLKAGSLLGLVAALCWLGFGWQQNADKSRQTNLSREDMEIIAKTKKAVPKLKALGVECEPPGPYVFEVRLKKEHFDEDGTIKDNVVVLLQQIPTLATLKLDGLPISDAGMAALQPITTLTRLELHRTKVGDAGLAYLQDLTDMEYLYFESYLDPGWTRDITDAGLANLKGMTKLMFLGLSYSEVTDAGLVHVKDMTRMRILYLRRTQVRGPGLIHLKNMTGLTALVICETPLDDAGLEHLPLLPYLEAMFLRDTKVTDKGLKHIASLPSLRLLRLEGLDVTDAGVRQLAGVKTLQELQLSEGSKVTEGCLNDLKKALPKLQVKIGLNRAAFQDRNGPFEESELPLATAIATLHR